MRITPRMLAAAAKALEHDVDRLWLEAALEHHEGNSITELKLALREETADFERKGGRDVDQAEFIDGLKAAIAVKRLPEDPKAWSPRKKPKMGAGPKEWRPGPKDVVVVLDDMERVQIDPDIHFQTRLYSAGVYPWRGDPASVADEKAMDEFIGAVQAKDVEALFRTDQDDSAGGAIGAAQSWAKSHGYRVLWTVKLY